MDNLFDHLSGWNWFCNHNSDTQCLDMVRGDVQSHCCCCRFHLLMKVYLHFSFSVRWGCLGRPVSQRTLPALCGSPLPEPLNVAPSFVFTSCEGDSCKDFEPLSTIFRFRPVIWDVMFWLVPLEYVCGNGHRNGKIGKRTKTFLIYPQKWPLWRRVKGVLSTLKICLI